MATLVAVTILGSVFLPRDIGPINEAFEHRAEERILATQNWEREFYPTFESPPPHRAHRAVVSGGVEQWRGLVSRHFDAGDVDRALCLMGYESSGDPTAENSRSTATGLFQIMHSIWGPHFGVEERSGWFDPETNIKAAAEIKQMQGWGAWSPWGKGLCRNE